jgi:hypothetical protein
LKVGGGLVGVEVAITPLELRVVGGGSGTRLGFRGFNLVFMSFELGRRFTWGWEVIWRVSRWR